MASLAPGGENTLMQPRSPTGSLGFVSAVATWIVVTGTALYLAVDSGAVADITLLAAALALVNGAAMIHVARCERRPSLNLQLVHGLQLLSALAVGILLPISFVPIYTIVWIAMAIRFYSFRACLAMLFGVLLCWYLIERFAWQEDGVLLNVLLYGTFHLFALFSAHTAALAEAATAEAEALNRELLATQHLLSEASRQSERTRIARDLHDLLGHHLTALSLNLQIAERKSDGEVRGKVEECRSLARLLLSDVRDAVSRLRDDDTLDIRGALSLLAANVPQLDVSIRIDDGLAIGNLDVAESLLRCAQEALTNSLRHAGASRSSIRIWREKDDLFMSVTDNGRVQGRLLEGNGIAGMRERLEQLNGTLDLEFVNEALRVSVRIPGTE